MKNDRQGNINRNNEMFDAILNEGKSVPKAETVHQEDDVLKQIERATLKKRRFQTVWTEKDFERLRRFAFDEEVSINSIINECVLKHLDDVGY